MRKHEQSMLRRISGAGRAPAARRKRSAPLRFSRQRAERTFNRVLRLWKAQTKNTSGGRVTRRACGRRASIPSHDGNYCCCSITFDSKLLKTLSERRRRIVFTQRAHANTRRESSVCVHARTHTIDFPGHYRVPVVPRTVPHKHGDKGCASSFCQIKNKKYPNPATAKFSPREKRDF